MEKLSNGSKKILLLIFFSYLFSLIIITERLLRFEKESAETVNEELLYIPSKKLLKFLSLGHSETLADLMWIRTILYYSEHFLGDVKFKYLEQLLNRTSDLDPLFKNVYLWGGAAFMYNGAPITTEAIEKSNRILKKGFDYFPEIWEFPYQISVNYAVELRDYKQGAFYMDKASKLPNSPPYLKTLAAMYYIKSKQKEKAMDVLEENWMYDQMDMFRRNAANQRIVERMNLIYPEKKIGYEDLKVKYEDIINRYNEKYNYLPFNFFFLVDNGDSMELKDIFPHLF